MNNLSGPAVDQLDSPYSERWELLKDVMVQLYMQEKKQVKEIVKIMEADYKFYASVNQYKRQFGLWNVKRALPTKKKKKIRQDLETRAQQGKSSVVLHNGQVENKKMRRYMKEQTRKDMSLWTGISVEAVDLEELSGHALQCGNRVFMNWSMPSAILRFLKSRATDHISPYAAVATPMSGVLVATPSSNAGPSPRNPPSPANALSPNNDRSTMTATVQESLKISRAHLFIQKHHKDLLRGMNLQEHTTTDWMHQLWQYSFITAKNWGRGPRIWNSSNLNFQRFSYERIESLPGTPTPNVSSPEQHSHYRSPPENLHNRPCLQKPSDLCHWSIHVQEIRYDRIESPEPAENIVNPEDENTWRPWSTPQGIHEFVESLQENLHSNAFSTIEVAELPISAGQIIRAAKRSSEQLLEEAFGFSIMARNRMLVWDTIKQIYDRLEYEFCPKNLYPLHLASSYLDGSKTCCGVFEDIVEGMSTGEASIRKLYTNHLNHSVLDNLMIAILKAHTSCTPVMVDEAFKTEHRFAGEEVDICGRWDADSDCIRHLQASGSPTIPLSWKHMFCHTSVQAITHCIGTLFGPHWGPDIHTASGLFLKRCSNEDCGLKLQLKPLHTLVITAVYLAQLGRDEENLFGMVACLLSLLGKGADPLLKADISLMALLGDDNNQECTHSELDPLELAQSVPQDLISKWPHERMIGWRILCAVLRLSQIEWDPTAGPDLATSTSKGKSRSVYGSFVESEGVVNAGLPVTDADVDVDMEHEMSEEVDSLDGGEYEVEGVPGYCPDHTGVGCQKNFFGKNMTLATLWAAMQTELLTYRRLDEGDPWLSTNFDMESVLESLENGDELSIGLVSKRMMNPFCRCGIIRSSDDPACLRVEEACTHYFSNLEDWSRSNFLLAPYDRIALWEGC
ncbi:uncharacterized protein PAC_03507 [Phialocephala subalpina]|uniref:Clr5 domain-containing protein n=1 Tax=Phialocephala subalpina TaxID=576137 RepID=A0A1L7WLH8_9HELO|nr:uncharacterized protein PAC_03507 [Phialocephala subalpina]